MVEGFRIQQGEELNLQSQPPTPVHLKQRLHWQDQKIQKSLKDRSIKMCLGLRLGSGSIRENKFHGIPKPTSMFKCSYILLGFLKFFRTNK
jgi:hypothetical protein